MWVFASRSLYKVSTCVGYMLFESTVELRGGNLLYVSRTEGSGFDGPQVPGTGQLAVTGAVLCFPMNPGLIYLLMTVQYVAGGRLAKHMFHKSSH